LSHFPAAAPNNFTAEIAEYAEKTLGILCVLGVLGGEGLGEFLA
jgi:hypothetical protein